MHSPVFKANVSEVAYVRLLDVLCSGYFNCVIDDSFGLHREWEHKYNKCGEESASRALLRKPWVVLAWAYCPGSCASPIAPSCQCSAGLLFPHPAACCWFSKQHLFQFLGFIRMWSFFPSFFSQFRPNNFFQPYMSQSSAAFRPLTRGQWLTPPAFRPRSHMLPKVHICWMNQWCGGGFQIEWTFPLLRGLPMASLPPQSSRSWSVVFRSEEKSCPGLCCQWCQR